MKKTKLIDILMGVVVSVLLLGLCSCYHLDDCGGTVIGSGRVMEEQRHVGSFDNVQVHGSATLFFRKGAVQPVRIVAEDNILPIIDTRVQGDTLVVDFMETFTANRGVEIYVTMPEVRGFETTGSCNVYGEAPFRTDNLTLRIGGSGVMQMEVEADGIYSYIEGSGKLIMLGKTQFHRVRIAGSGVIDALGLTTVDYDIRIDGSGECRIFVSGRLDAHIAGSGSIYYQGNPSEINSSVAGSGRIVRL